MRGSCSARLLVKATWGSRANSSTTASCSRQIGGKAPPALLLAGRADLDLGIDMLDDLLEQDIDTGAALVRLCGHRNQILATMVTEGHLGNRHRLHRAGVARRGSMIINMLRISTRTSSLTLPAAHKASNWDLTLSTSARTDCLSTEAIDAAAMIR